MKLNKNPFDHLGTLCFVLMTANVLLRPSWDAGFTFAIAAAMWLVESFLNRSFEEERTSNALHLNEQALLRLSTEYNAALKEVKDELKTLRAANGIKSLHRPNA